VSCDLSNLGCDGGFLSSAIHYLETEGIVTESCMSYTSTDGSNKRCPYRCDDKSTEYKKYGCKYNSMRILTSYDEIKEEIYLHGPVMVGFEIFDDFDNYSTGYYEVTAGAEDEGSHAVTFIGWGYNSGRLYWIAQNEWGTSWGQSGFFNIYAGEAGIDIFAIACDADFS